MHACVCVYVCVCQGSLTLPVALRPMGDHKVITKIWNTTYRLNKDLQMQIYLTGLLKQTNKQNVTMCFLNGEIPRVPPQLVCKNLQLF